MPQVRIGYGGKFKRMPAVSWLKQWDKRGSYFGGWADSIRARARFLVPVMVREASWAADLNGQPTGPLLADIAIRKHVGRSIRVRISGRLGRRLLEFGSNNGLVSSMSQCGLGTLTDDYRLLGCPPKPDTQLDGKAVERLEALAKVVKNWQAHPSLFSLKRVHQLRQWMPGVSLIPQRVGTKVPLAKNYGIHGVAWNHLADEQNRQFDHVLSCCNRAAYFVGRASKRLVEDKRFVRVQWTWMETSSLLHSCRRMRGPKGAQKSSSGHGGNYWCNIRLNRDNPFPDGVVRIMQDREADWRVALWRSRFDDR